MSYKRPRSPSALATAQIFKSSPIVDRSSTFIAVYSPTFPAEALQALPEFRDASHRMAAWRKPSQQRSLDSQLLFLTDHDDDGESYGGKSLEKVLIAKNVVGAIVVARWYGGVMLGPVRFDHIRNCAGNAIVKWSQDGERAEKRAKKESEKQRLIKALPERDQNIAVLRSLLVEKKGQPSCSKDVIKSSPVKSPDYASMELPVLERLEQVRDKTIAWILGQIEKAEEMLELISNTVASKTNYVETEQTHALHVGKLMPEGADKTKDGILIPGAPQKETNSQNETAKQGDSQDDKANKGGFLDEKANQGDPRQYTASMKESVIASSPEPNARLG